MLVHTNTHQMRHDVSKSVIVIALDPHDLDVPLWIGEFANLTQELPVLFGEAGEIEIGEDVAQQDQALKTNFLQQAGGFASAAGFRTEVQIGEDQRVVEGRIHTSVLPTQCYGAMKCASKLVQR